MTSGAFLRQGKAMLMKRGIPQDSFTFYNTKNQSRVDDGVHFSLFSDGN